MPMPVQVGSTALALSKQYALKGKLPLKLDEVIVPVHIVGQLESQEGVPCIATMLAPGAAAENGGVGLINPADSGILARVTSIGVGTQAGGGWQLRREESLAIVPDATQTGFTRDARDWGRASTLLTAIASENPIVGVGPFYQHATQAEPPMPELDFWLLPNTALWAYSNLVNESIRVNWFWTEFPLEPSQT